MDETALRLLDEAIDLMIRRQSAPDNSVTLQTINVWRARSDAHERIWQRVSDAHGLSGVAVKPSGTTRRNLMLGGLAAIGIGAVGGWAAPVLHRRLMSDAITATAQLLPMDLPDGSRVLLGPDSAIAADARDVRLLRGMAWFDVIENPAQPFAVRTGGAVIRTTGAAFEVSVDAGDTNLAVGRGMLTFAGATSLPFGAGEWARFDPGMALSGSGRRDPELVGMWQQGLVVAQAEPLRSLVARVSRWLPEQVLIANADLGRTRISGLYDMSDPTSALNAVVGPTGANVRTISGVVTVISKI